MADDRTPPDDPTPPSDGRPGMTRRSRRRPTPMARPVDAAARVPNDPASDPGEAGGPGDATQAQPRPWEVAGPHETRIETAGDQRERPRTRRRVTVSQLLADVPDDAVIVTRRLSKQYGDFTAVENLDLTIRAGEVFGLLGPNGAGKTT